MPKIIKMSEHLSNLIAAGEVVDRPSSVIKELVENSLDANSNSIKIEVFNNGLTKIIVTDNGNGMDADDLHLALLPHATSKIKSEHDLVRILTNGFRGEALASIASVAEIKLSSKMADSDGYFVHYQANKLIDEGPIAQPLGTKVEITDLFANVPARFKFLKNENAERLAIISVFERLALGNPAVGFALYFDDELYKQTSANQESLLLETILGKNIYPKVFTYLGNIGQIGVKAYLVSPEVTRANRRYIHLFVNQRPINNYYLANAIIKAYGSLLMTNRYPIGVLYLTIDPQLVDVNVHPQKTEIKLANELFICFSIERQLKEFLVSAFQVPIAHVVTDTATIKQQLVLDHLQPTSSLTASSDHVTKALFNPLNLEYIGQLGGTYLLCQNQQGLYLIDQHAAAEKIRYETTIDSYLNHQYHTVNMLFGLPLNLTNQDLETLNYHIKDLTKLGFIFKDNEVIGYPSYLKELEIESDLISILGTLREYGKVNQDFIQQMAINISCKKSVKANTYLSIGEVNQLINDLFSLPNYLTCPHGRPVIVSISNHELEKMFKRVV